MYLFKPVGVGHKTECTNQKLQWFNKTSQGSIYKIYILEFDFNFTIFGVLKYNLCSMCCTRIMQICPQLHTKSRKIATHKTTTKSDGTIAPVGGVQ